MEKYHPGIWIGAAIAVAVVIVAVSVPRNPSAPETPAAATSPARIASTPPQPPPPAAPPSGATAKPPTDVEQTPPSPAPVASRPSLDPDYPPPPPAPTLPPATRENVRQAIDDLDIVIRDFRSSLGGNPVGTNAEITGALLGNNLKQLKLRLPDNSRLNANGELCDIWGTPYFFHQQSGTRMEIRSAGPDRKLWTGDDVTK